VTQDTKLKAYARSNTVLQVMKNGSVIIAFVRTPSFGVYFGRSEL
jgi:hypothetical protein